MNKEKLKENAGILIGIVITLIISFTMCGLLGICFAKAFCEVAIR